jgi:hypothetical protein
MGNFNNFDNEPLNKYKKIFFIIFQIKLQIKSDIMRFFNPLVPDYTAYQAILDKTSDSK